MRYKRVAVLTLAAPLAAFAIASCFLSEFVPAEFRDSAGTICHKILLNEKGDTIESLEADGGP